MAKSKAKEDTVALVTAHINSDEIAPIYLLTGNEKYLLEFYRKKLLTKLGDMEDTLNFSIYKGESCNIGRIVSDLQTLPFFAERRVVYVSDSGFFKSSNEELLSALQDLPESSHILFSESEVDKRGKLYKTIAAKGKVFDFSTPDDRTLIKWLKQHIESHGLRAEQEALQRILIICGNDMTNLSNEIEKITAYAQERGVVTVSDVEAVCSHNVEDQIFAMTDAIGQQDHNKTIALYNDLLLLKESPYKILSLIQRHYKILLQISHLLQEGKSNADIAKYVGVSVFFLPKYSAQAQKYDMHTLLSCVDACLEAECSIKTGIKTDVQALELLILELTHL